MVFNVNKQWVLHNLYRKSILNKYDHFIETITLVLLTFLPFIYNIYLFQDFQVPLQEYASL